jgi:signal transduction histidine kinase
VKQRGSLTWRVLVILAAAAVIPTVIVGALAIRREQGDVEEEVVRGNLALVRALGSSLDATLQDARRALAVGGATWADGGTPESAARLVRRLRREVPIVASLSLISPDGAPIAGDPLPTGVDPGFHTFGGYVGDVVFVGDRPVVPMAVQARSRTGELVGVLVAELDLAFIGEALGAARLGPGARLVVVDGAGITVARSDHGPVGGATLAGRDPAVDRALGSTQDGSLSAAGVVAVYRNLASYQSLRGVRWSILLEQPEDDAYALARRTTRDTILFGALALALALVGGALLAARLTRPLGALTARADAIAAGDAPAAAPVRGPGEIGQLGERIEDMARRLAERAELQSALARGDRLATVGTMSASVAHEVNNPLTTVLGYAQLMLEDKPDDHPDRPGLELIAAEAARMKAIVAGLLDYARVERDERARGPADLAAVLRRVTALLEPQLRRARVTLALDVPAELPEAAASPHALQQVLVNLIQNAAQAMPDGGTARVVVRADTAGLVVRVSDEGPGVDAADRARIFEPFFTTKEAGAGTGLGLAVCKRLASEWGGAIELAEAERGATFRVVIPTA